MNRLAFFIAFRYFFSRKKTGGLGLITIISGISLLGYLVGAAALVIVLSVFNGFESLFSSLYTNFDPDIKIVPKSGKIISNSQANLNLIRSVEGVLYASATLEENVLLRYNNQQTIATIKGVDEFYDEVTRFDSTIINGFVDIRNDSIYAVVGQGIAYRLSVDPNDVFKPLGIYVPNRDVSTVISAEGAFNKALVYPGGVFSVQEEVDNKYIVCPLTFTSELLNRNNVVSAIDIKVENINKLSAVKSKLNELLGANCLIKDRYEQRETFFKVMKSEKAVSYMILLFILLVAASNTIGSLYILVIEKTKDITIMKSMGLTSEIIRRVFLFEGLMISVFGGGIGIILGLVLSLVQQHYGIIAIDGSINELFSAYPIKVIASDVLIVFITVVVLGVITSWYPALKAEKLAKNNG